jgi:legumain
MKFLTSFFAFTGLFINSVFAEGTNWAVLVAGSNTYSNYRHQADICHAYQVLSGNGISDENIIVFMYDDIANNKENPKKGEIINHPDGKDVYKNVPKDYIGDNCNADNFLSVLKGKDMTGIGSEKTLRSTNKDKVFIYYADHGATGLVAMPYGGYLYATDLIKTIQDMYDNSIFKEMVFYMEACESGSMFENLPTNLNVYVTTASNPTESSYACYYDSKLKTYLGDCYSVNWMENSDSSSLDKETLEEQYDEVKQLTTQSHVMQYGQLSIDNQTVSEFMDNQQQKTFTPSFIKVSERQMMDTRNVDLKYLVASIYESENSKEFDFYLESLFTELKNRERMKILFEKIDKELKPYYKNSKRLKDTFDNCFKKSIVNVEEKYGKFTDYSLQFVKVFYNACKNNVDYETIVNKLN